MEQNRYSGCNLNFLNKILYALNKICDFELGFLKKYTAIISDITGRVE